MEILRNTETDYTPENKGLVRFANERAGERKKCIEAAFANYGSIIPLMAVFTLDYLGMMIRQHYDQREMRNQLIADICLLNSYRFGTFQRMANGGFRQL